jgi:D-glycero-alpha-D-manno-heptose-7-phosphate kinase
MKSLIVTRAPLRISFSGGGTDFENFYKLHGGAVISSAINRFVNVETSYHSLAFKESFRIQYSEVELVNSISEIKNHIVRESLNYCVNYWGEINRLTIAISSDIPSSSGLGSSSSLTCALVLNLSRHFDINLTSHEIAEIACQIELDVLQKTMGKQDAYAAAFGGVNFIEFNKKGIQVSELDFNKIQKSLQNRILLVSTGEYRKAESILKEQFNPNKEQVKLLSEIYEKTIRLKVDLESTGYTNSFEHISQNLIYQSKLKKKISNKIYSKTVNRTVEKILNDYQVKATKISGAGGGGFILCILNEEMNLLDASDSFITQSKLICEKISLSKNKCEVVYEV